MSVHRSGESDSPEALSMLLLDREPHGDQWL
jgi:hypothetical protein